MFLKNRAFVPELLRVSYARASGKTLFISTKHQPSHTPFTDVDAQVNFEQSTSYKKVRRLSYAARGCPVDNNLKQHCFSKRHHGSFANVLQQAGSFPSLQQTTLNNLRLRLSQNILEKTEKLKTLFQSTKKLDLTDCSNIPGPKGVPLLGSALDYSVFGKFSPKEYQKALLSRHSRYGSIFRERLLNDENIYISDPKDIGTLIQNEGTFPHRSPLEAIEESRKQEGLPQGITAMQGEEWLQNRNAINPAVTAPKVVKKYRPAQVVVAKDLITLMNQARDKESGEIADFDELVNRWALESVAIALLDTRLGVLNTAKGKTDPKAERLHHSMDVFFDYGARLTFGMPIWKLWKTKSWKIFRQSQREEFEHAGYFVERKLQELEKEKSKCPMHKEAVSGCPVIHKKTNKKKASKSFSCLLDHVINNTLMSKNDAITVCLELLAGGIDTTKSAAVFALYHLSRNQNCQEHLRQLLREEEANLSSDNFNVEQSKFSRYLKACIRESMRLKPLTYANTRKTTKEMVLSGFKIPAGTSIRYTSHLMNLKDQKYFARPDEFLPERWLDRASPYRCTEQFVFTPFGHGARQCPGRRIAEQELDILFRELIANYHISYKYEDIGIKTRLFNGTDKPAKFSFSPLNV